MEAVPSVIFKSVSGCALFFGGSMTELAPNIPALVPAPRHGPLIFSVWSFERDGTHIPKAERIVFENCRPVSSTLPLIDWGDVIEARAEPLVIRPYRPQSPRLLSTESFFFGDRPAKAELYLDGGLRLALTPASGEAFSIPLGEGAGGSLRRLDLGRETMLAALAETDEGMRLILIDRSSQIRLDEAGTSAAVAEGFPTVYTSLPTVRGYERRTRFDLSGGAFKRIEDTGFFTHGGSEPRNDPERALSFFEELKLGLPDAGRGLLSDELEEAGEELKEFIGPFDRALLYPVEEPAGKLTVGLIEGEGDILRPRRLTLRFDGGRVDDIVEL